MIVLRGLVVAGAAAVLLAACGGLDGEQARLCRAVLPALEPAGRLIVTGAVTDPVAMHGVRLAYRVEDGAGRREGVLRCAFAGGRLDGDRLNLLGVEKDGEELGPARLAMLKRFWLAKPDAVTEGEARLGGLLSNAPLIGTELPGGAGYALQQAVSAMPIAAIYAFLATAYALIYGLVNRINLAFGELSVGGAYAAAGTVAAFGSAVAVTGAGALVGLALALGAGIALLHGALLGALLGELVFRRLARTGPRAFLIASIGLAIALSEATRLLSRSRELWLHPVLNETLLIVGGPFEVTTTPIRLVEIAAAVTVLGAVFAFMRLTGFGRSWRAAADDPVMARFLGIDTDRVAVLTFALSGALAAFAGALGAFHYGHASYSAGLMIGLKALVAALLGGIGSLTGAALGGVAVGFAETFWGAYLPVDWRDVAILVGLVVVLVFRPGGLFGDSGPPLPPLPDR